MEAIDGDVAVFQERIAAGGTDANHAAFHVEDRAARIAPHDDAIGGDVVFAMMIDAAEPHRRVALLQVEADRVAQGDAPLAESDIFRLGNVNMRPVAAVGDFHQPGIARLVVAERYAAGGPAVGKREPHGPARTAADVGHGHHQPIGTDHDAAAARDLDHRRADLRHQRLDMLVDGFEFSEAGRARDIGGRRLSGGRLGVQGRGRKEPGEREKDDGCGSH